MCNNNINVCVMCINMWIILMIILLILILIILMWNNEK